ncbi:hypothetical protein MKX01_006658 [Papaver californicum]|nr:hypothetical protein MKX01_006658 [Papaver californicum]
MGDDETGALCMADHSSESTATAAIEVLVGIPLLIQQFGALFKKNIILAWRNKMAFIGQLFSPVLFILLLVGVEKLMNSGYMTSTTIDVPDPEPLVIPPIPPCEKKFYIQLPCYDFAWSGNESPSINCGEDNVRSFKASDDVDAWLYSEPLYCAAALHFVDRSATVISYGIRTNDSDTTTREVKEDFIFKYQLPLQIAADREIARFLTQDPNLKWNVELKEFAHPATEYMPVMLIAGWIFLFAIALFPFTSQIASLVAERELKLRQAMSIMGLYESAYWLSWLVRDTVMICISSLVTITLGVISGFNFFVHNSFMILFLGFFLFQLSMVSFAFAKSTVLSKSSSANTVGFFIFLVGWFTGNLLLGESLETIYRIPWNLFPPNVYGLVVSKLNTETSEDDTGITWSDRNKCPSPDSPCMTMVGSFKWLLANFIVWFFLTLYMDNVIPNSSGVGKSVIFFLEPDSTSEVPLLDEKNKDTDEDVLEEERMVRGQMKEDYKMNNDSNIAVQIRGLAKAYPGTIKLGAVCCIGVWMNFEKDQLFCLLGPNGAGKTTTINSLIYGNSVRSSVGMTNIRRLTGVCPQFDILWTELSCEEHLHLFGSIKGLPPSLLSTIAKESLANVKLAGAAGVRAGSCGGGMKCHLSCCWCSYGDPKLVILDEPTTGMDPVTRRHVWDVIEDAKKGQSIILTTHSMEEADTLGDCIAIVAKGKLRCIGTSLRLKSRFAESTSRQFPVDGDAITDEPHHLAVKQFFKHHLDVVPKEENKSFLDFFDKLEDKKNEFGIGDIQLGLTTLEEVFLNIAKKAELENALKGGGGRLVKVIWEQDDTGFLKMSGHSKEYPVPPNAKIISSTAKSSGVGLPEVGIIYDLTDTEASSLRSLKSEKFVVYCSQGIVLSSMKKITKYIPQCNSSLLSIPCFFYQRGHRSLRNNTP